MEELKKLIFWKTENLKCILVMNQLKFHFMEETKIIDIIICCDSMLPLVQILFHFVLGYGNVW